MLAKLVTKNVTCTKNDTEIKRVNLEQWNVVTFSYAYNTIEKGTKLNYRNYVTLPMLNHKQDGPLESSV